MADTTDTKVQNALEVLENGIQSFQSSSDWQEMLVRMARRGKYSVGRFSFMNQIICAYVRENPVDFAATYKAWSRIGRFPRKGSKSFSVLRPLMSRFPLKDGNGVPAVRSDGKPQFGQKLVGFSAMPVFSLEDTDGEDVDLSGPKLPDVTGDECFAQSVEILREVALGLENGEIVKSFEIRERNTDSTFSDDHPKALGWYNRRTKGVVVITEGSRASQFMVAAHEVAHALLHGSEDHHETSKKELEAQSVAFVVCTALGLDTNAFSMTYISTWCGSHKSKETIKEIQMSGSRIYKASKTILAALLPEDDSEQTED
jgi:hypothetical protein